MEGELLEIVQLFGEHAIPVLVHKGPVLSRLVYGDPALREYSDLDLLLPPAELARARQLLANRGYQPLFALTPALDQAVLESPRHYHVALKHQLMVELHWKIDAEFPVGTPESPDWWAGCPTVPLAGRPVLRLGDEELVLALLLHGSKHLWEQLNSVMELAELIRSRPMLDWEEIRERAVALRAERRVALGLSLLAHCYDLTLPSTVISWVSSSGVPKTLAVQVAMHWGSPMAVGDWNALDRLALNLKLYDSVYQRVHHVGNVLRPGFEEWVRWPLPKALHALYLPLRAARLLGKYFRLGRPGASGRPS